MWDFFVKNVFHSNLLPIKYIVNSSSSNSISSTTHTPKKLIFFVTFLNKIHFAFSFLSYAVEWGKKMLKKLTHCAQLYRMCLADDKF